MDKSEFKRVLKGKGYSESICEDAYNLLTRNYPIEKVYRALSISKDNSSDLGLVIEYIELIPDEDNDMIRKIMSLCDYTFNKELINDVYNLVKNKDSKRIRVIGNMKNKAKKIINSSYEIIDIIIIILDSKAPNNRLRETTIELILNNQSLYTHIKNILDKFGVFTSILFDKLLLTGSIPEYNLNLLSAVYTELNSEYDNKIDGYFKEVYYRYDYYGEVNASDLLKYLEKVTRLIVNPKEDIFQQKVELILNNKLGNTSPNELVKLLILSYDVNYKDIELLSRIIDKNGVTYFNTLLTSSSFDYDRLEYLFSMERFITDTFDKDDQKNKFTHFCNYDISIEKLELVHVDYLNIKSKNIWINIDYIIKYCSNPLSEEYLLLKEDRKNSGTLEDSYDEILVANYYNIDIDKFKSSSLTEIIGVDINYSLENKVSKFDIYELYLNNDHKVLFFKNLFEKDILKNIYFVRDSYIKEFIEDFRNIDNNMPIEYKLKTLIEMDI